MFDAELEKFKTQIDLRQYVLASGYYEDKKESSKVWRVFRHRGMDDKVIVHLGSRNHKDHWVYTSTKHGDHGTIIDFVQNRSFMRLGAIRKELRPWIGKPPVPVPDFPPPVRIPKDRLLVENRYGKMQDALRHPYLENERALPADLLGSARFAGRIRIDSRGNAVFPHFDTYGLCGYEIKNKGFTSFAPGGTNGLWLSRQESSDTSLIICESAIDALSYAVLFPDQRCRYASIGGNMSPAQPALITEAAGDMPRDAKIVAAMDTDENGGKLADVVCEAVRATGREDLTYLFRQPRGFKDWNDQLRGKQPDLFPMARVSGLDLR
jgi:Toprim-like/Protein of unknown function (DUF3991)